MDINDEIKDALNTKVWINLNRGGSGCINTGESYQTDNGMVFVKRNMNANSIVMFDGEMVSLNAMIATNTVRVPKPLVVVKDPNGDGSAFVIEYLDIRPLSEHSSRLGELIANLHLNNDTKRKKSGKQESWITNNNKQTEYVREFGFDATTCCGFIPLNNEWCDNWIHFFARNRLEHQIRMIDSNYGDRDITELWSHLQLKLSDYFVDIEQNIVPALLHGDLWSGNAAQLAEEPVVYDPSSFYGHSEFELSLAKMFGGFNRAFFDGYHSKIPKTSGFDRRIELYQLFHYFNHWNHFGGGYRHQSLALMRKLIKSH